MKLANILYVHHSGTLAGGDIALLRQIAALDKNLYHTHVTLFEEGPLLELLRCRGISAEVLQGFGSLSRQKKENMKGISLLNLSTAGQISALIGALQGVMLSRQIALVHTNTLKAHLPGGLAARRLGLPLVWHMHDRIAPDYLPRPMVALLRKTARWLPDTVIANSVCTLRTLQLPRRKPAAVVYPGLPLDEAVIGRPPVFDAPVIGMVGRFAPWKGQHVFLEAASLAVKKAPGLRFRLIGAPLFGEDDYALRLKQQAKEAGLEDKLEYTGFRNDIPQQVADLDMLVHCSIIGEPFGQVIVEGMAAERPVIASQGGGALEIIQDGINGILTPMGDAQALADAMLKIVQNAEASVEMGKKARERVLAKFTIDKTADAVEAVYSRLLA